MFDKVFLLHIRNSMRMMKIATSTADGLTQMPSKDLSTVYLTLAGDQSRLYSITHVDLCHCWKMETKMYCNLCPKLYAASFKCEHCRTQNITCIVTLLLISQFYIHNTNINAIMVLIQIWYRSVVSHVY